MKTLVIVVLVFTFQKNSMAQFENTDIGAKALGLNGAFTSLADNSLSVFYNPSGLGQMKYREISVHYSPSPYGVSEISTEALTFAEPFKFGTIGISFKTFGYDLYRETNGIFSYANNIKGKIFYGFNLCYYNLFIKNYNSASSIGADIGALAYLTEYLKWGFFVKNLTGSTIGTSKEKIAQVYKTGFTIQPESDLNFAIEIEKDVKYNLSFKGAIQYSINDYVDVRSGIGTQPASFSGGVSLNYNIFQLDYAMYNHSDLGIINQGTLTVNFGGSKARKIAGEQLKKAFN